MDAEDPEEESSAVEGGRETEWGQPGAPPQHTLFYDMGKRISFIALSH